MTKSVVLDARAAWNLLKGFVCLYKPPHTTAKKVKNMFFQNMVDDLNELSVRPPKPFVKIEGNTTKPLSITIGENYADNPLIVGPRYQVNDFKYGWPMYPGAKTSGVTLLAINRNVNVFEQETNHWQHCLKAYHIKGTLGLVTNNMFIDGKVLYDNVKYQFIRQDHIDKVLAAFQANFQKKMYEQAGVHMGTQEAYKLAVQGPIRPAVIREPVVYGLKCIQFTPPHFTIEVHCIGEYEEFLIGLIYDLGEKLRSSAVCSGIQCIRFAQFTLEQSLLRKHWRVEHVIDNIVHNERIIGEMKDMTPRLEDMRNTLDNT